MPSRHATPVCTLLESRVTQSNPCRARGKGGILGSQRRCCPKYALLRVTPAPAFLTNEHRSSVRGCDAFGRAVSVTSGTTTTNYLFDGMEAVQEKVGTNAPTYYTRGLGDQLISRRGGGYALKYYHHDSIGSVLALTNNTGDLTDTYSYTAFGGVRARTGTDAQPYQYVRNFYDANSKLHDFHARAYDSSVGRFTSKDPVADLATMPQSLNPYSYGYNGPLVYPDQNGECPICVVGAAAGYLAKNALQSALRTSLRLDTSRASLLPHDQLDCLVVVDLLNSAASPPPRSLCTHPRRRERHSHHRPVRIVARTIECEEDRGLVGRWRPGLSRVACGL